MVVKPVVVMTVGAALVAMAWPRWGVAQAETCPIRTVPVTGPAGWDQTVMVCADPSGAASSQDPWYIESLSDNEVVRVTPGAGGQTALTAGSGLWGLPSRPDDNTVAAVLVPPHGSTSIIGSPTATLKVDQFYTKTAIAAKSLLAAIPKPQQPSGPALTGCAKIIAGQGGDIQDLHDCDLDLDEEKLKEMKLSFTPIYKNSLASVQESLGRFVEFAVK